MEPGESRIALLIDADNAPASKIDVILAEVARHGAANVRRAYGDWKSPGLKQWEATLHAHAIRPIQQFAYSRSIASITMAMSEAFFPRLYANCWIGRIAWACRVASHCLRPGLFQSPYARLTLAAP